MQFQRHARPTYAGDTLAYNVSILSLEGWNILAYNTHKRYQPLAICKDHVSRLIFSASASTRISRKGSSNPTFCPV